MNKVYISGPMSNIMHFNFPKFNEAAYHLRQLGFEVINPAENGHASDKKWEDYLRADIKMLVDCQRIYMLPGWQDSRGARLEFMIAEELGLEIMYSPECALHDIA
jgi:Domain of unknown function (DUF4406)